MDGLVKEAEPRARRTLKASPAMVARLGKAAAQHAADKPAEPPPLAQQKPALAQPKPTSNEVAKINPPLDPEAAALRRARRERHLSISHTSCLRFSLSDSSDCWSTSLSVCEVKQRSP